MMVRVTHDGNIVSNSQRYLQFRVFLEKNRIDMNAILLLQLMYYTHTHARARAY